MIGFAIGIIFAYGIVAIGAIGIVAFFGPCDEARFETFMDRVRLFIVIGGDCMPTMNVCNPVLLELEWARI